MGNFPLWGFQSTTVQVYKRNLKYANPLISPHPEAPQTSLFPKTSQIHNFSCPYSSLEPHISNAPSGYSSCTEPKDGSAGPSAAFGS